MDIFVGKREDATPVNLKIKTFLRHMVCLGASGSGKTVACKVICEEFIKQKIPVIAVDPQGDIASLLHCSSPKDVADKGITAKMIKEYQQNVEVVIWTPASSVGVPLSLNPIGLVYDAIKKEQDYEESLRSISLCADGIIGLMGEDINSDSGRLLSAILNIILNYIVENKLDVPDFTSLADLLLNCPENLQQNLSPITEKRDIQQLSKKLRLLTVGTKKLLFDLAKPLDIEELLGLKSANSKKTRLSVIYLNTLSSQEEKEFFVGRLASALYNWMLANPSNELQALLYIDEVAPYLPPVKKPVCKDILNILLKQARKYGVGCLIASQNPGDIDYKAISQCSTWNLGRLISRQDIKKVERILRSLSPEDAKDIANLLPSLNSGEFLLFAPDEFDSMCKFQVRWLITEHKTLDEEQVRANVDESLRRSYLNSDVQRKNKVLQEKQNSTEISTPQNSQVINTSLPIPEQILSLLEKEACCLTCSEVAEKMGIAATTARKHLGSLGNNVSRSKYGKSFIYWHPQYSFLPEYNLIQQVEVAKLQVLEREALRLAEKRLKKQLIFFESEEIQKSYLEYIPLWQVHFTEELHSSSFLFFKSVSRKQENIYFHAIHGKIAIYKKGQGFYFVDTPRENPSILSDLDDVCTFQNVFPGDLNMDWKLWDSVLSEKEIKQLITRKFSIEVHKIAMTFLPVWRFAIIEKDSKEKRSLFLDGITGMPIEDVEDI